MFHVIHAAKASQYSSISNYIAQFRPQKSKLRFFHSSIIFSPGGYTMFLSHCCFQPLTQPYDPWLLLRTGRRTLFVFPHSKGSFSRAAVSEPVNRCPDTVRHSTGPHEPVGQERLAGRAGSGVYHPPSIWKAIWTFHSEKTENSYSNLGILLLCPTWRKSFRKLPHCLSLNGR